MRDRNLLELVNILYDFIDRNPKFQRIAEIERIVVLRCLAENMNINLKAEDEAMFMARAMETYLNR